MSQYQFDPAAWLVSLTRAIEDYAKAAFPSTLYDVRMSFPDPLEIVTLFPTKKVVIHFERDAVDSPVWAFGIPGVDEWSNPTHLSGTFRVLEAQRRLVNFDVGVWASLDAGGETSRMLAVQMLHDLFGPAGARQAFNFATGGIVINSFEGGRDATDRVNDLPVWRTMDMRLAVEVFSKSVPATEVVPETFDQTNTLVIDP